VAFSHGDAAIQRQAAHIDRDRYFNFDQMDGSMAGVLTREAPQWKGRHPGEDGHAIWASHLAEFIKNGNLDRPPDLVRTFERTQGSLTLLARLFGRVAAKPSRDRDPFIYP
jgi:hypothetical protein